jgi:hypothetical protein
LEGAFWVCFSGRLLVGFWVLLWGFPPPFAGQAEAVFCPFWSCFCSSGCVPVVLAYISVFCGSLGLDFFAFLVCFLFFAAAFGGRSLFAPSFFVPAWREVGLYLFL